MDGLRQYALNLIIGALICGIVLRMVPQGPHEALLRFLSGIFLTVTLLSPLVKGRIQLEMDAYREVLEKGEAWASDGAEMARRELQQRISAELESYILDKASSRGADLQVSITLGEDSLPVRAVLYGTIPETVQQEISCIITQDLGIPKENQLWIG